MTACSGDAHTAGRNTALTKSWYRFQIMFVFDQFQDFFFLFPLMTSFSLGVISFISWTFSGVEKYSRTTSSALRPRLLFTNMLVPFFIAAYRNAGIPTSPIFLLSPSVMINFSSFNSFSLCSNKFSNLFCEFGF